MGHRLYVLLIAGNERRFLDDVLEFNRYLTKEVGLPQDRISTITNNRIGRQYFYPQVESFFKSLTIDDSFNDVVILYRGHGNMSSMLPNIYLIIRYDHFAGYITNNGNFIFINGSCCAVGAIPVFQQLGLLLHKGMILASSQRTEESNSELFMNSLYRHLRQRREFQSNKLER